MLTVEGQAAAYPRFWRWAEGLALGLVLLLAGVLRMGWPGAKRLSRGRISTCRREPALYGSM
ncbi:MAG: hypothetical protein LLG44_14685 [Chloroflexi bacterium]|nr:hypothetical protein [Chloroflexota bacterium]